MNKDAFLAELRKKLSGLPQDELEERLAFYGEMIDDRMADGASEEDAVAGVGPVGTVVDQIMSEIPLTKLVGEKVKSGSRGGKRVLLALGAPLWIPLLIVAAAVLLSLYAVIWAAVICFWAVDLSLAAAAVACLVSVIPYLKAGNAAGIFFAVGAALACAGLAVLLFCVCKRITAGVLKLTQKALLTIKNLFVGKGE